MRIVWIRGNSPETNGITLMEHLGRRVWKLEQIYAQWEEIQACDFCFVFHPDLQFAGSSHNAFM